MNAVKEFKGSYVKLFSNALHNGFHTTVWKYLRSLEDKTKIHLSDELLTEYGTNIAAETELNRETRAHVNTAALNEADAKRDKAMSYLFNVIEAAKEAVVPDIQAGGMALSVVILPYKGIQQLAHKEESAAIDGCLQDIRKPENSPYVLSLNLGVTSSHSTWVPPCLPQTKRTRNTRIWNRNAATTSVLRSWSRPRWFARAPMPTSSASATSSTPPSSSAQSRRI